MPIRVECYAGYRAEQEPLAFWCGDRKLEVRAVVDRWFAATQRWFKVDADDGRVYILRHDERAAIGISRQVSAHPLTTDLTVSIRDVPLQFDWAEAAGSTSSPECLIPPGCAS